MKHRTKQKRSLPLVSCAGLMLVVSLLLVQGYTLAKYLNQDKEEALYTADSFYFTSDYLMPQQNNGQYVHYTLQEGVDSIVLELRNYGDALRSSQVDISYEVTLNDAVKATGELKTGEKSEEITLKDLQPGQYTVVARATAPYTAAIGAVFTLVGRTDQIEYAVYASADSPLIQLTVRTNDYSGPIVLTWGAGIYPDKTDPMLAGASYGANGSYEVTMGSNTEYTFRFLKSDLSTQANITAAIKQ